MLTARCCARDYLRQAGRKGETLPLDELALPSPDDIDDLVRRQTVNDILDELGEPDRTIIAAKYLYCLPQKAIAKHLKLSEKAVESRLFRARQKLMERFTQAGLLPSVQSPRQAAEEIAAQKGESS